jgi:transposase
LDESEKICDCCGELLQRIGAETSKQLDIIPLSLRVIEHVCFKYACKGCEKTVVTANKDRQPIEKGIPAAGLLAHVAVSKYVDNLPLYRLEGIFRRHDIDIKRSTMCGWAASIADLLMPLYDLMAQKILQSKVINTDDTPFQVQDKTLDGKTRTGRIWIYCGDKNHPYHVYDYTTDRSRAGPEEFFEISKKVSCRPMRMPDIILFSMIRFETSLNCSVGRMRDGSFMMRVKPPQS